MTDMVGLDPFLSRMPSADIAMMKAKAGGLSEAKLKEIENAAGEFESMFVSEMLKPMFETVETDEVFGGGESEETWRSLLVEEYGKQISRAGGIGLSDDIKAKMIEMQEAAQAAPITGEMAQK